MGQQFKRARESQDCQEEYYELMDRLAVRLPYGPFSTSLARMLQCRKGVVTALGLAFVQRKRSCSRSSIRRRS